MDFLIAKERERGKELERKLRELKTQGTDLTFGLNELRELQKQAHQSMCDTQTKFEGKFEERLLKLKIEVDELPKMFQKGERDIKL